MKTRILLAALLLVAPALHAGEGTFGTGDTAPTAGDDVVLEPIDLDLAAALFSGLLDDLSSQPPQGDSPYPPVAPAPKPGTTYPGGKPGGSTTHTVVRGDTLWALATRYCGSGNRWREIFQANRGRIRDPHWIYPGQVFRIPCSGGGPGTTYPGSKGVPGGGSFVPSSAAPPAGATAGSAPPQGTFAEGRWITHRPARASSRIISRWGASRDGGARRHKGTDFDGNPDDPIYSIAPGVVTRAEYIGGYGWAVYVRHPNGYTSRYAHLRRRPPVRVGQQVAGGQYLGPMGNTGNAGGTPTHVHFEVRRPDGEAVDPESLARW